MVTVFLRGGLGNQMFQYALGLNLSKKNGTELVLDTVHLRDRFPRPSFSYRAFDLDIFEIVPHFTGLSRGANAVPILGMWLGIDILGMGLREFFGTQKIVREKSYAFDPSVLTARDAILLYGRWQSEKYFMDVKSEVRAAFRLRCTPEGEAAQLAEHIRLCNSVSLHVRRGDFAAFKNVKELMGDTDLPYYSRAVAYIGERVKEPHFFVFSDDIEWCKANLKLPFPVTYASSASAGPKASWHMELMSLCKHNIVANSTFSWWGAWLNANPQKIIVAPKHWLADPAIKEDIVPEGWIKL